MISMNPFLGDETAPMPPEQALIRRALIASFVLYAVFGLPDGVFGTVWPNLRDDFDRTDSSLGLLILATAVGYAIGSVSAGHLSERFGTGRVLPVAMTVAAGALGLVAAAPGWWFAMLGYALLGTGWGFADASVNAWMALTQGPRQMGMLHASYGVGAFLGPLLATSFVAGGTAWRAPYVACMALTVIAVITLIRARPGFVAATTTQEIADRAGTAPGSNQLLILMVTWFSIYVGIEVALGSWSYTLLTESRGFSDVAAGILTASFWGGLMAGRFVLAAAGHRLHPEQTLRISTVTALFATAILWADPLGVGGLTLPLIGFTLSAMFPVVMGRTAVYLGEERATRAVGYQIGATSIGFTALPSLIGLLSDRHGVGVAAPVVLAGIIVMGGIWMMIETEVRRQEPADGLSRQES
jgi:fucose permease